MVINQNPNAYMDAVTAARAMLLDEETALEGSTLISIEASEDEEQSSVYAFIQEHFADFIRYLRRLNPESQELLLQYYILGKTQNSLTLVTNATQTTCSLRLRMAVRLLLGYLMGEFSQERIHDILLEAGVKDDFDGVPLSQLIVEYAEGRNFAKIAFKHDLDRPKVRKAIIRAQKILLEKQGRANALGAYLYSLTDRASYEGTGRAKKHREKDRSHVYLVCPPITGKFRFSTDDPDFGHMFVSRANRS